MKWKNATAFSYSKLLLPCYYWTPQMWDSPVSCVLLDACNPPHPNTKQLEQHLSWQTLPLFFCYWCNLALWTACNTYHFSSIKLSSPHVKKKTWGASFAQSNIFDVMWLKKKTFCEWTTWVIQCWVMYHIIVAVQPSFKFKCTLIHFYKWV